MPTMATGQSWVRPSSRRDLVQQVLDVVADAPGAVGAEVREVLAHLGRVHAGQLGQPLRGDRRRPGARRSRAAPGSRAAAGRPSPRGSCVLQRPPSRPPYRPCDRILKVCDRAAPAPSAVGACGPESVGARPAPLRSHAPMVAGLAFVATAVATLFAQATAVRWSRTRAPAPGRLDHRARPVRARLGRVRDRVVDRLGRRHVPGLLPPRRDRERAVARARHRLPARRTRRIGNSVRAGARVLHRPRDRRDARRRRSTATITDRHDPGRQGPSRRAAARARRHRQRRRRGRADRRRAVVGGAVRPAAHARAAAGSRSATC